MHRNNTDLIWKEFHSRDISSYPIKLSLDTGTTLTWNYDTKSGSTPGTTWVFPGHRDNSDLGLWYEKWVHTWDILSFPWTQGQHWPGIMIRKVGPHLGHPEFSLDTWTTMTWDYDMKSGFIPGTSLVIPGHRDLGWKVVHMRDIQS